ncbi:MAG TPA: hypothetical protein VFW82_07610 [Dyella sp.]|nr:hypothetical protein [Dyella sp.]
MRWITASILIKQFGLPRAIAGEIVGDALRCTLFRSRWCWAWLVVGLSIVIVLAVITGRAPPHLQDLNGFMLIIGSQVVMIGWRCLGQWLAGPAMLAAAERWSTQRSAP